MRVINVQKVQAVHLRSGYLVNGYGDTVSITPPVIFRFNNGARLYWDGSTLELTKHSPSLDGDQQMTVNDWFD